MATRKYELKRGVSALSYGLLVGLIGVVALAAVTGSGSSINELFGETSGALQGVVDENVEQPAPSAAPSASASPSPTGLFLVINDATLAATLESEIGSSGWTPCYEAPLGDPFDHGDFATACGSASELLQIDTHGSTWSGSYLQGPLTSYYATTWRYPPGFYFSSVSGRSGNLYSHNGSISSSGTVRIEFNGGVTSERFHINAYRTDGDSDTNYYASNGDWQNWNLYDGGSNVVSNLQSHMRFYSR
ncbi:MAG: hypothetical protein Alpg2KO_09070 [Alphaproteobacteria bacterium]